MLREITSDNPPRLLFNDSDEKQNNLDCPGDFELIREGVIVLNESGQVLGLNSAFRELMELADVEYQGIDIGLVPGMGNIPAIVRKEILAKKRSANFIGTANGREIIVFGNCLAGKMGKQTKIVLVLMDLVKLRDTVLNAEPTNDLSSEGPMVEDSNADRVRQEGIIASSDTMKRVINVALRVAKVDSSVLINGETGVGKEILANFIHRCSKRNEGPFIKINCSAIPDNLIESELFGYESGAFTGAKREGKTGLVEMANGGTLFLDEIGDLPLPLQVKMLRVLQEREIQRVGGVKTKKVNFRLIAATNRDLEDMVKKRQFREDLFYRLNVVPVTIPPLRERKEEIMPLTSLFLDRFNKKYGLDKKISSDVIQSLLNYEWPGNVRELENTIERLVVTSDANTILMENLSVGASIVKTSPSESGLYLRNTVEETERHLLLQAIQQCKNTREMAVVLGISQSAVVKKMRKHGIAKSN